ncbi:TPA: tetratricopeptide repeat protein [Methanosarcinaceae archaeon]|nr:tetratricopeptide repeat protein [Methanosarcinaceae archaeon]
MQPDTLDISDSSEDPFELLQQAINLHNQGNLEQALDLLVRAEHSAFASRKPESLVVIYSVVGDVFSSLEDFERSLRYFEKSLQVIKLFEADDADVAEDGGEDLVLTEWSASNENKIGKLLFRLGQTGEAEKRFNRALGLYEKLLEADSENVQHLSSLAKVKDNVGTLLSSRGQIDEACVVHTEAADIRRSLRKRKSE